MDAPLQLARTLAMTVLGALVAGDSSGTVLRTIHQTGLPDRILQDLVDTPNKALLQVVQNA